MCASYMHVCVDYFILNLFFPEHELVLQSNSKQGCHLFSTSEHYIIFKYSGSPALQSPIVNSMATVLLQSLFSVPKKSLVRHFVI